MHLVKSPLLISPCHQPTEPQIPGTSACPCYPFTVSLTSGSPWRDLTAPSVIWPSQVEGPKNLLDSRDSWESVGKKVHDNLHQSTFFAGGVGHLEFISQLLWTGCWHWQMSTLLNKACIKAPIQPLTREGFIFFSWRVTSQTPWFRVELLYWIYFDPNKLQAGRTTWEMSNETSKGSA